MSDQEFTAFADACRSELSALQNAFLRQLKRGADWFYDLNDCTLRIGDQIFSMTPIGTYSSEYRTWLWAWANEEFPSQAREASMRIQQLHSLTGFAVFLNQGTKATPIEAQDLVAMAVRCLGAIGFFRTSGEAPMLYLAVHQ